MQSSVTRSSQPRNSLRPAAVKELPPLKAPRLLDQVRERVRMMHYGLRTEQAYVRVKDIEFTQPAIYVRQGKGSKDRVVMLPASLAPGLQGTTGGEPVGLVPGCRSRTMICTHVLRLGGGAVRNPLDALPSIGGA